MNATRSRGGGEPRPYDHAQPPGGGEPRPYDHAQPPGGGEPRPYDHARQPNVGAGFTPARPARRESPPGRKRRRAKVVALSVVVVVISVVATLSGLRMWTRFSGPADAPRVGLSIGADFVNDVGLHQAPYQATLGSLGARVVELSPRDERSAAEILDELDCVVLTGGGDVDPVLYGGDVERAFLVDTKRDHFEMELIHEALRRDMPILMVCRGHQILNVSFGGTLRDIRLDPELSKTHGINAGSLVAHPIDVATGSLLHGIGGADQEVNSFHGQIVDRVGNGLRVTARSPDGVVEALEVPGHRYAVSVQWHPEMIALGDPAARGLFAKLLEEAKAYRSIANQ